MDENKKTSSVSKASSLKEMGDYWDTHDFTDFDSEAPDVKFEVTCAVPVEIDLFAEIQKQAQQRGVSVETLVNLWLQQKAGENKSTGGSKTKYRQKSIQRQVADKK